MMPLDKVEYGDFQTPPALARRVVRTLSRQGLRYGSILEPTCGRGSLLLAAAAEFDNGGPALGFDINPTYLEEARQAAASAGLEVTLALADFFQTDWAAIVKGLPGPVLILGNPPWVTSAELGRRQSMNLPIKSNFQHHRGLDALTGKSNFDISEWMLLQHLRWLEGRGGTIAMLLKQTVARKVLRRIWGVNYPCASAKLYAINATRHFGAAVEACLLVLHIGTQPGPRRCDVFDGLDAEAPSRELGFYQGHLVPDLETCLAYDHLLTGTSDYTWRSGIKHDHARVMELTRLNGHYQNGFGELCALEDRYVFPLLKSSDVAKNNTLEPRKWVLVTQRSVGEPTNPIARIAPNTWAYLQEHREHLAARRSSIYRGRPPFSIFGVGEYTFAPWKVAISGFYKALIFNVVAPYRGRPVVFDDTVYFLACQSKEEAHLIARLLNHPTATKVLAAQVFFGDKRPITVDLLKRLNLRALAKELDLEAAYLSLAHTEAATPASDQPSLGLPQ